QTMPRCTVPWTALTGTTAASSAVPLTMSRSAPRPGNAVTSPGRAHVTVPEVLLPSCWSGSPPAGCAAAPMRRPVHVNGAGPPLSVTCASAGAPARRYCWSGVRLPVTDSEPGVTCPTVSPTDTTWSLSVGSDSVPPTGEVTVSTTTF